VPWWIIREGALPDGSSRQPEAGDALIKFAGRQWTMPRGDWLTIGRSRSCTIQLPADDHLSRVAALLRVLEDCVLIRNESRRKPLVLRPPVGEDRVIEPGAATTSLPFGRFELILVGRDVVAVGVDVTRLARQPDRLAPTTRAPATAAEPIVLTGAQRRVLVALCAPMLTESGPRAQPATYAQIGQRLGRQPQYIRNIVKSLRESLSGYGVEGLTRDDSDSSHDDFRWALARWAIRSGWVSADDVDGADGGK